MSKTRTESSNFSSRRYTNLSGKSIGHDLVVFFGGAGCSDIWLLAKQFFCSFLVFSVFLSLGPHFDRAKLVLWSTDFSGFT